MVKIEAQQILLAKYASFTEDINLDYSSPDANFKLVTKTYDTEDPQLLQDGEVLVENVFLSNDPAQKGWFTPYKSYVPPVPLGSVAPAQGLGRVLKSKSAKFAEGDYITGRAIGWATHNIIRGDAPMLSKLDPTRVPHIVKYLSAFGSTTLTAYFTATKYSGLTPTDEGKVWLITGAAGAAGSSLIQIVSNIFKPKLILAVAGGEEKRKWVETLGDKVVGLDYKSKSYKEDFAKALGDEEIDVFADHVGGWILEHALPNLRVHGKVVQIGAIASYNDNKKAVFSTYAAVITKRLTIQGIVLVDDIPAFPQAFKDLGEWFTTGKLDINKFEETIVQAKGDDFKKVPELWTQLFKGVNKGKYITQVADYPTSKL